jgi:hypothetical protein
MPETKTPSAPIFRLGRPPDPIETLARFRPDLSLLAELDGIAGEDDYVPLGHVPSEWCDERRLGNCMAQGSYADIYSAYWVAVCAKP